MCYRLAIPLSCIVCAAAILSALIGWVGVAQAYSHDTQTNWNGVVDGLSCANPPVWIDDLQVYPDVDKKMGAWRSGSAMPPDANARSKH